jgi:hypothetical protein
MGLDHWLTVEFSSKNENEKIKTEIPLPNHMLDTCYENSDSNESYEIVRWRKFNAIHSWFVENVQNGIDDCGKYEVSFEQIKKIYDILSKVLYKRLDPRIALPTKSGFFFGNTDYGDYYYQDVKWTKEELESLICTIHPTFKATLGEDVNIKYFYGSCW